MTDAERAIPCILLAAGESTRLGVPKQLVAAGGEPLLRLLMRVVLAAGCSEVIVVLGCHAEEVRAAAGEWANVRLIENHQWRDGMGRSLSAGVQSVPPEASGVMVMTCDQPLVDETVLRNLQRAWGGDATGIALSEYAGTAGPPAIFGRAYFPELRALSGDVGAKPVVVLHAASVRRVAFPGGEFDIDRPADLNKLDQLFAAQERGRSVIDGQAFNRP